MSAAVLFELRGKRVYVSGHAGMVAPPLRGGSSASGAK
jgi:hypothetical protein